VLGKVKMLSVPGDTDDVTLVAEPTIMQVTDVESDAAKSNTRRIGKSGRKRKEDDPLPSNKLKKPTHGAGNFIVYQELCVEEETSSFVLAGIKTFRFFVRRGRCKLL